MKTRLQRVAVGVAIVASATGLAGCSWPWSHSQPASTTSPSPSPTVTTPAPSPTTPAPTTTTPAPTWSYVVQPNDYFDGIAWADGISPAVLLSYNPQIRDPHWINPGDVITLPQPLQQTPPKLPPSPVCDGGLVVTEGAADGFLGHISQSFTVTNRTGVACTLDGYPGFEVPGVPVNVIWGGGQSTATTPSRDIIPPGGTAQFRIEWTDVTDNPASCLDATRVRVTLPGQFTTQPVSVADSPVRACPPTSSAPRPQINVGPVTTPGA